MNKTLKTIQEELEWLVKDYKASINYDNEKFIETLNYQINYERKKIKLLFQFLLMPKEETLTMKVIFQIKDKNKTLHEKTYPFSKIKDDLKLPMINDYDKQRIEDVLEYEVVNGKIKSVVSQLTQGLTYTEIIRRNIKDIIKHGRDLRKEYNV
ncbi:MAG: hypothetical protein K9L64_03180 [Candidatus Izimaplasma sp.]|nr:hypothetical protein [Candidatus Izimaplasma bacterium]